MASQAVQGRPPQLWALVSRRTRTVPAQGYITSLWMSSISWKWWKDTFVSVTWHASSYEAYGVSHAQSYPQAPHPSHQLALHQCIKALRVVKWLLRLSLCLWKPSCPCSVHESKVIMTRPGSRGKEKGLANFEICKGGLELSLFSLAVGFCYKCTFYKNLTILSYTLNHYTDFNFEGPTLRLRAFGSEIVFTFLEEKLQT